MKKIRFIEGNKIDLKLKKVVKEFKEANVVPALVYDILLYGTKTVIGECDARLGMNMHLYYSGNIGFSVYEKYRGNSVAEEAVNLLKQVFKANNVNRIIIATNPDNHATQRVCEKLGAKFMEKAEIPEDNDMRILRGETHKLIWYLELTPSV